jgi:hypothetical protein
MTALTGMSRKRLVTAIVVLDLAGAGLLWTLRDHILPHHWLQTNGQVVNVQVQDMSNPTGVGFAGGACLVVKYRYQADNASYESDKYRASGACLAPSKANQVRYQPGTELVVWYDQDQPAVAVIDPTYEWDAAWIWCLFLLLIALGNFELIGRARRAGPPRTET